MSTIRALLLALLVAGLTLFSVANNSFVPIDLGFIALQVWLPLLVLAAFLLGLLPVWLRLAADRLILRRKVSKLEAALAQAETDLAQARVELLRPPAARPEASRASDIGPEAPESLVTPAQVQQSLAPQPQAQQPHTMPRPAPPPGT